MKILKRFFKAYINSSLHVATAVCAFVGITALEFSIPVSMDLLGFVFFGTITGYNFVKYAPVIRTRFKEIYAYLKVIQICSLILLIYFSSQLSFYTLVVAGGFALLTFFYAIPFLKNKNFRSINGIKTTIVAIVWAGVTVILPLVNEEMVLDKQIWLSFLQRIIFVFVLTLPFEIRDLPFDDLALGTLPQRVGVGRTKILGVVLLFFVIMLEIYKPVGNLKFEISLVFSTILLGLFLWYSKRRQSKYYASFWVESIPVIWWGVLCLLINYLFISF